MTIRQLKYIERLRMNQVWHQKTEKGTYDTAQMRRLICLFAALKDVHQCVWGSSKSAIATNQHLDKITNVLQLWL